MSNAEQKIVQYLSEAHASERALTRVLQEQIAVTPRGNYRDALEKHLRETRDHATRVGQRLSELGVHRNPVEVAGVLVQSVIGQGLALAKTPLDLLRGSGGEEKVLKNAKDAAATEALEIATYTSIERLATDLDDERTARLARSIRADEERMLEAILEQIPQLTGKVVAADVRGNPSYDVTKTGAGEAVQAAASATQDAASRAADGGKKVARTARKAPGVARAEGAVKGAVASADDLAIPRYDDRTAEEITERLGQLSQIHLLKIQGYEGRHQSRKTVLESVQRLVGQEPWPGYDEQSVPDIRTALATADGDLSRTVATYERRHKDRTGVLQAVEASATV